MKYFLLFLLSFSAIPHSEYILSVSIPNKKELIQAQEGDWWCWAATMSGLMNFYGKEISQVDVVKSFFNKQHILPIDYISPKMGIRDITKYLSVVKGETISIAELKTTIDNGYPTLLIYKSHVAIVTGYFNRSGNLSFEVMDPAFRIQKTEPFIELSRKDISKLKTGAPSILIRVTSI